MKASAHLAATGTVWSISCRMAATRRRPNAPSEQNATAHFDAGTREHRRARIDVAVGTNR